MRTRIAAVLGVAGLAAVSSCVPLKRTPEARFFILQAVAEPSAAAAPSSPGALVGVLPARLPGYLDRLQLVTETEGNQVMVDEYARWIEPMAVSVTRTLRENLAVLLPRDRVVEYPWPTYTPPRCRVLVEFRSLGPRGDRSVRLEGRWALLPNGEEKPLVQKAVILRRGPLPAGSRGVEPGAAVAAMSDLLAELARQVAAGVEALPAE